MKISNRAPPTVSHQVRKYRDTVISWSYTDVLPRTQVSLFSLCYYSSVTNQPFSTVFGRVEAALGDRVSLIKEEEEEEEEESVTSIMTQVL